MFEFQDSLRKVAVFDDFDIFIDFQRFFTVFQVEGILHNASEETNGGLLAPSVPVDQEVDVPTLNKFDQIQPLDDLLIRRRSIQSSPANSRWEFYL